MPRVAILIDGDNIGPAHADHIAVLGLSAGRVDVHRVYVNAASGTGWPDVPGVEVFHAGAGKNATDLLLTVDAMELALSRGVDVFVLASSDRDFSHLATRLRAHGREVIGAGEAKTTTGYRKSCTWFVQLEGRNAAGRGTKGASRALSPLDRKIMEIIETSDRDDGGAHLSWLGKRLREDISGGPLPAGGLKKHVAANPQVFELYPSDQPVAVRLRDWSDTA
ncbi:MAG: NYN domain-containing protein [Maritimibacter sp.]|nr:NYN domain-containing protein [Maritimibacter sp.]